MGVAETKIYPINTGWLEADLGTYIFWKGPAGKKYWNPVYCYYVDTGEHKILIDTGLPDEERATKWHHKCEKRGCLQVHEHLEQKLGVHPDEIDAIIFTHLHWDHVQNMKEFKNARYIAPKGEIEMAYNPLPLYYRTYEANIGVEQAYAGCVFEAIDQETEVFPGITMFHTPGHSVGHMAVSVETRSTSGRTTCCHATTKKPTRDLTSSLLRACRSASVVKRCRVTNFTLATCQRVWPTKLHRR